MEVIKVQQLGLFSEERGQASRADDKPFPREKGKGEPG